MINLEDLHKTWSTIIKNQKCNTQSQTEKYVEAIQHGKCVIGDVNYKELLSIDIEDVKIIKAMEDLYQKFAEAQENAFDPIVKQTLKKR